ncbi:unnamed protein product [Linum trigynum]|uniref:Uncharacterized protein n=1 Tax=Linum trigynum TaxID=586398 RepID=A0AAV2GIU2_9ROSI
MAKRLQGKVALITGGARGIGAAAARLFSQHGAKVVIADIRSDLGQSVSRQIQLESGHPVSYVQCDVADDSDMQAAVDTAVSTHGKLDIMYSNAGIIGEKINLLEKKVCILSVNPQEFRKMFDVNVYGSFLAAKHAARVMIPEKSGTILLTGSVATATYGGAPHIYAASKHAVVGLAKNLCVELGQFGIRVNCISPFGAATPMNEEWIGLDEKALEEMFSAVGNLKGVVLKPEDVAEAALNLVSDESKYLSGLNLLVDGGFCLKSAY